MNPQENPFSEKKENTESQPSGGSTSEQSSEFVWSFRGYRLRASEFTTAMVHFFRAEVQRANVWRTRLDATTNWAVITTGAVVTYAFSSAGTHLVILVDILLVTIFLLIEARRYRYYELWSYRVRLMETDFFAPMLVPPFHPSADWAETLSESLLHPRFPISNLEALGRRLRRNYLYIYGINGLAWLASLYLMPDPIKNIEEFFFRAAIGPIEGQFVLLVMTFLYFVIFMVSGLTIGLREFAGEVLPRFGEDIETLLGKSATGKPGRAAWFRPSRKRPQLLTMIITDMQEKVSNEIIKEMGRGVTAIGGKGMFTGKEHPILLCALTVTEVPHLKSLVANVDPKAFVIVIPASEVLGLGFLPLEEEE